MGVCGAMSINIVCYLRVIKHNKPPAGVAFEVRLWEKQDACLQTLNMSDVICSMHLKGGVTTHGSPKKWGYMTLKENSKGKKEEEKTEGEGWTNCDNKPI